MAHHWTTRCCSAFALIAAFTGTGIAQQTTTVGPSRNDRRDEARNAALGLFPATELWDLPLNNLLQATPVFKGDRGYFPIGDGQIAAYDVRHGTLLWIAPAHALFEPILAENMLFTIEPDAIVALRDDTGVEAWRVALDERLSAPLVCHNGWLIATAASGAVLAFRASDGVLIWRQDLDAVIHASATVADDRVYLPMTDGRIIALQIETGEHVWEHRLGGAPNEIAGDVRSRLRRVDRQLLLCAAGSRRADCVALGHGWQRGGPSRLSISGSCISCRSTTSSGRSTRTRAISDGSVGWRFVRRADWWSSEKL